MSFFPVVLILPDFCVLGLRLSSPLSFVIRVGSPAELTAVHDLLHNQDPKSISTRLAGFLGQLHGFYLFRKEWLRIASTIGKSPGMAYCIVIQGRGIVPTKDLPVKFLSFSNAMSFPNRGVSRISPHILF
jgi:hypothetical protein